MDALTPLSEGITPSAEQVSKLDITAVVSQFGKVVQLSDDIIVTVQDETSNEVADMLAQNMSSTYDKIIRNMLNSTATQIDCLNGSNGNAITDLSVIDLEIALDYIETQNGKKMAPVIEGRNAFGTAPVWAAYWMIVNTALRSDVKSLSSFLPTASYANLDSILESEFGSVDEIRVVRSSEGFVDTSVAPAVYSNFLIAANAYGMVSIDDQSMEMIIKPLGSGEDSLNQRSTMGWKGRLGSTILDDSWVANVRSTKG